MAGQAEVSRQYRRTNKYTGSMAFGIRQETEKNDSCSSSSPTKVTQDLKLLYFIGHIVAFTGLSTSLLFLCDEPCDIEFQLKNPSNSDKLPHRSIPCETRALLKLTDNSTILRLESARAHQHSIDAYSRKTYLSREDICLRHESLALKAGNLT